MLKQIIYLFLFFNSLFFVFGDDHYADIQIYVDEIGKTTISGITQYEGLIVTNSDLYTSKAGSVWTFELNTNEVFSDFIFELNLPKGAQTNYIKTTPTFRITHGDNNNIKIIGTGENRELNILVQYTFEDESLDFSFFGYFFSYLILGLVILFIILFVVYKKIKKSKIVTEMVEEVKYIEELVVGVDYSKLNLNDRQLQIIEILKKYGEISQKDLMQELNIPKASVSRNLQSMLSKNIILIKKNGITNIVSLLKYMKNDN